MNNINRILLEFVSEESKLGMRKIQFNSIMEEVLLVSTKNEIPKKSLVELYKSMPDIDSSIIKDFLIQDFFFTDNTK